jgi:DNA invertase Pin-like site-specific DNA recombinase
MALPLARELIVENTREGLTAARARGRVGGRKPKLSAGQVPGPPAV